MSVLSTSAVAGCPGGHMGSIDCKGNRVLHGAYLLGEHPEQAAQLAVPAVVCIFDKCSAGFRGVATAAGAHRYLHVSLQPQPGAAQR